MLFSFKKSASLPTVARHAPGWILSLWWATRMHVLPAKKRGREERRPSRQNAIDGNEYREEKAKISRGKRGL